VRCIAIFDCGFDRLIQVDGFLASSSWILSSMSRERSIIFRPSSSAALQSSSAVSRGSAESTRLRSHAHRGRRAWRDRCLHPLIVEIVVLPVAYKVSRRLRRRQFRFAHGFESAAM